MMYLYLFVGVIIGILVERYVFPIFDIMHELLTYKAGEKANELQLNVKGMFAEFDRAYPETVEGYQEESPAIGFQISPTMSEFEDDEEEDCNGKIGFKL